MRLQHPLNLSTGDPSGGELRLGGFFWNVEELLADLYNMSGMPECWQRFLARICHDLHASTGMIVRRAGAHEGEQVLAAFAQNSAEYARLKSVWDKRGPGSQASILPATENGKAGDHAVFAVDLELSRVDCLLRSLGVRHLLGARHVGEGQSSVCLAIGRTSDEPQFDPMEMSRFASIGPHFEWAVQLAELFAKMTANVKASTAVLDLLPTGVVILDEHGACVTMNRAAREALDPEGSALRFIRRNLPKAGAADDAREASNAGPQVLSLPNQAPGQRSVAVLWDLPGDAPDRQRTLAFIIDPDHKHSSEIDVAALERIYGLTVTEARVAALVAESSCVADIAEHLGSTAHTVRTHLRHIFEKTGTDRQADLVHLLLQSPLALRLPRKCATATSSDRPRDRPILARG